MESLPNIVAEIMQMVEKAIQTMKVKGVSASRAGRKIQTRVIWKDELGKTRLGYFSATIIKNKLMNPAIPIELVKKVLGLEAYVTGKSAGTNNRFYQPSEVMNEVHDALENMDLSVLAPICKEINAKMKSVINDGSHVTKSKSYRKEKARKVLTFYLDYALVSGISDTDIRDMVKEAIVRNTMDS